jgi:hypothetical protein
MKVIILGNVLGIYLSGSMCKALGFIPNIAKKNDYRE